MNTLYLRLLMLWLVLVLPVSGQASSIMIWPTNPVLKGGEKATPLWVENRGSDAVLMQLRVFSWAQDDSGEQQLLAQREIIGSPPMMKIMPGQRQLVRLTRMTSTPASEERAYRILIDEIPLADGGEGNAQRVQFQMRYSVPLFAYGDKLWVKGEGRGKKPRDIATVGASRLTWAITPVKGRPYLQVRNEGNIHARLNNIVFDGRAMPASFFGYVLPGRTVRWPLPAGTSSARSMSADVNGEAQTLLHAR